MEIGTLGGYSTIWLARALANNGHIVTLELEDEYACVAETNVSNAGFGNLVNIITGPAAQSLEAMGGKDVEPFDFVFVDADKQSYVDYLEYAIKLSRSGAMLVFDNVVREGEILDPDSADPKVPGTRALYEALKDNPAIDATAIQTVGSKKMGWISACRCPLESFKQAMTEPSCQLYLISPLEVGGDFPVQLKQALEAGSVAAFQFRVKAVDQHQAAKLAKPLQAICDEYDVAFVVNDDVALAKRLGADGLHLGQDDEELAVARNELGPHMQIGITCHDSRHLAMEAGESGANYVAFGAFFPTETKETRHQPEVDILEWWSQIMEIPCVAIGGITPENCQPLVDAGADFLAVSGSVWNCPLGPANAVKQFAEILRESA